MRRLVLSLLVVPLLHVTLALGQHFTPEEQEIIDLNQHCWEAWASEDLDQVRSICNEHPDARGWDVSAGAPDIGWFEKYAERWADAYHPTTDWVYFEVKPLSVRIFNDTALIHFWSTRTLRDDQNKLTTLAGQQLNIWQRQDGKWTWIGGMANHEEQ